MVVRGPHNLKLHFFSETLFNRRGANRSTIQSDIIYTSTSFIGELKDLKDVNSVFCFYSLLDPVLVFICDVCMYVSLLQPAGWSKRLSCPHMKRSVTAAR